MNCNLQGTENNHQGVEEFMLKELNLWVILHCILTRALITIYPSWLWKIRMRHCITKGDRLLSMHKDTIVCRSTSSRMLSNWCFPAPCSRPHYSSSWYTSSLAIPPTNRRNSNSAKEDAPPLPVHNLYQTDVPLYPLSA